MKSFRNQVKIDVLMSLGLVHAGFLGELATTLDEVVISEARRALPTGERIVFFFLYFCVPSWEEVQELLASAVQKEMEITTLQDYARSVRKKLGDAAAHSQELQQWKQSFLKSQRPDPRSRPTKPS